MTLTMNETATPRFLDPDAWSGKIYLDGQWVAGSGGDIPVIEPATGAEIGRVGIATPADVARAAAGAAAAQKAWAAAPHPVRAGVLRKAAALMEQHAEEIMDWNVREVGSVPALAGFALHVGSQECYEAAALPSHPLGQILSSEEHLPSACRSAWSGWFHHSTCRSSSASARWRRRSRSATLLCSSLTPARR
jgi:benzaldehyde dehydrogenase (NAD)